MVLVMSWLKDSATVVLPLVGVWIGASLTRRSTDESWFREQRLAAYLDLLDHIEAMVRTFSVGLRVSKLRPEAAAEHGHDFAGVEIAWQDQMDELRRLELRVSLLGGRMTDRYQRLADVMWSNMLDEISNPEPTEERWDQLADSGQRLIGMLERTAREDMGTTHAYPLHIRWVRRVQLAWWGRPLISPRARRTFRTEMAAVDGTSATENPINSK